MHTEPSSKQVVFKSEYIIKIQNPQSLKEIATALITEEHTNIIDQNGLMQRAQIDIKLQIIELESSLGYFSPTKPEHFSGRYTVNNNEIWLANTGYVILESSAKKLRSHRIGTYLMDKIVTWSQQWPNANIKPIHLRADDATEDNKNRRNTFYENFGIIFDYDNEQKRSGYARPMLAKQLVNHSSWKKNIIEHPIRLDVMYKRNVFLEEISLHRKSELEEYKSAFEKAFSNPLWFTFEVAVYHLKRIKRALTGE